MLRFAIASTVAFACPLDPTAEPGESTTNCICTTQCSFGQCFTHCTGCRY